MISKEERESIINEAIERILLRIPDVVGNLIMNQAAKIRTGEEFYKRYPEFKDHREVVASVIERLENASTGKPLDKIVEEAVPEIRKTIKSFKHLDTKKVSKPNLDFSQGDI